jgi:hypothetical protein
MRQEVIDLLKTVLQMRQAQKRYFNSRKPVDLIESKRLETIVDSSAPALVSRLQKPQ